MIRVNCCLFLRVLALLTVVEATKEKVLQQIDGERVDFCVVGAGPSGLQLAQHFQSTSASYVVLERGAGAGNFYTKFPIHGTLISINKKYTGNSNAEFNLRHDWNSILTSVDKSNGTDFAFTDYSDEYFPKSEILLTYLNEYATHFDLQIAYNTEVKMVTRESEASDFELKLEPNPGFDLKCGIVVWAGGLGMPRSFEVS